MNKEDQENFDAAFIIFKAVYPKVNIIESQATVLWEAGYIEGVKWAARKLNESNLKEKENARALHSRPKG